VDVTLFEVEQAGCESCAALVRDALEDVGTVLEVTVDEKADLATVRLEALVMPPEGDIDRLLSEASPEGHAYRVRPGSWRTA
jgi:Heavy-metal-associated domain